MSSSYMHEYVHFVVETSDKQHRASLFAERDMPGDFVFVGQHVQVPSSTRKLPLPLRSLTFSNDARPSILQVAVILARISREGGEYGLLKKNCFWYAGAVYLALKQDYPTSTEQPSSRSLIKSWFRAWLTQRLYTVFRLFSAFDPPLPTSIDISNRIKLSCSMRLERTMFWPLFWRRVWQPNSSVRTS